MQKHTTALYFYNVYAKRVHTNIKKKKMLDRNSYIGMKFVVDETTVYVVVDRNSELYLDSVMHRDLDGSHYGV